MSVSDHHAAAGGRPTAGGRPPPAADCPTAGSRACASAHGGTLPPRDDFYNHPRSVLKGFGLEQKTAPLRRRCSSAATAANQTLARLRLLAADHVLARLRLLAVILMQLRQQLPVSKSDMSVSLSQSDSPPQVEFSEMREGKGEG